MLAVIDYGAGNLRSVVNAFQALDIDARPTDSAAVLRNAEAIVLPGVGAFADGIRRLEEGGLRNVLEEEVRGKGKPYLGICLGLHFMAEIGLEHGERKGLGWLPGRVEPLTPAPDIRIPHMGWNDVSVIGAPPLFSGIGENANFYFLHGYHLVVDPKAQDRVTAVCRHGQDIVASVGWDNIMGVQFHPEKSQDDGLAVLRNFMSMVKGS